jgi:isopenicillin N synthase-like dioxygenase
VRRRSGRSGSASSAAVLKHSRQVFDCQFSGSTMEAEYGGLATSIPVLDLRLLEAGADGKAQVAETMRRAFEGPGMVLMSDTGTDQALVDETVRLSKAFFDLPQEQKENQLACRFADDSAHCTYPGSRYSVQAEFSTPGQQRLLVNEHLHVREASTHPFDTENGYFTSPQGDLAFEPLPPGSSTGVTEAVPRLQETVEKYHRAMQALANKVERCFSLALGLDEHYIADRCAKAPIWPVTIAHYPAQPEQPPAAVQRINAHWDRDLFALVTTNDEDAQKSGCGIQVLLDTDGHTYDAATASGVAGRW